MKVLYRRVLEQERVNLVTHLEVNGEFIDELVSRLALDTSDGEIVNHECGNRERVKAIVQALKTKDDGAYMHFKQCLKVTKNEHVITILEKAEQSVKEEIESSSKKLREMLLDNFQESKSTSFLAANEIAETITELFRMDNNDSVQFTDDVLNIEFLNDNIMMAFPRVKDGTYDRCKRKSGRKAKAGMKSSEYGFYGISQKINERNLRREQETSDTEFDAEESLTSEDDINNEKIKMNVAEFYEWVKCILLSSFGDASGAEKFREDDIDGEVFDELTDKELAVYLPKLGQRKKLKLKWKELKELQRDGYHEEDDSNAQTTAFDQESFQSLRPFSCETSFKHKYKKESRVSKADFRKGSPLTAIHIYINIEGGIIKSVKDVLLIANETTKFGSACMNERTNGTIHFGISGRGVIKGCIVNVEFKTIERAIIKAIKSLFHDSQVAIALHCIRPAQFMEVIDKSKRNEKRFVIEIDVIPLSRLVENQAFFLKTNEDTSPATKLFRFTKGEVQSIDQMQIEHFMIKERQLLSQLRQDSEKRAQGSLIEDKNKILQQFLCCGNEFMEPSIFLFLILGENSDFTPSQIDYLRLIKWNVIFDFSPKDETDGMQVFFEKRHGLAFNTNFIEDFDPRKSEEKCVFQTEETLKGSSLPNWIYCNGKTRDLISDLTRWKLERCSSFRKAFEFYFTLYEEKRCKVFIPLFNRENTILQEAVEEVFMKVRENCLVVAESESISCDFRDALQKRNLFTNPMDIDDYFLTGLPWSQVGEAVGRFVPDTTEPEGMEIPRSTGVHAVLPEKMKNELCDIEIVCANECYQIRAMSEFERERMETKVGEGFYSGGLATWSNFYFSDQVLLRPVNTELMELTLNALKGLKKDICPVQKIIIYHQPGAGGSTTGRQVLWNIKEKYRCCVVKTVTKQTCEQICELRRHEESTYQDALPVLVLVDLDDEDAVSRFYDDMVTEGHKHLCETLCVLLICCRVSELPSKRVYSKVFLGQHLSDREQQWFKNKYKYLEANHKKDKGCNPETLLSFNIMKENFSTSAIDKYVSKYVRDPNLNPQHRRFLKYLAFINHFDKNFQPIPVSCFDPVMKEIFWNNHLPQSTRVLVNTISVKGGCGHSFAVRIANYLLSQPVLNAVLDFEKEQGHFKATIGEVALELLNSKIIQTLSKTNDYKLFLKVLTNIIKKRKFVYSGEQPKQFCLLIMDLIKEKDFDAALEIVDRVFDITDDPYVAQQLARLHAFMNNWNEAHEVIKTAMTILPDNHYLTHTCGHIYRLQFLNECKSENFNSDCELLIKGIHLVQKARYYFKESQVLSRKENVTLQDIAGFEGEIRLAIEMLKVITIDGGVKLCESKLHSIPYMNDKTKCLCNFFKEIPASTESAIETLEADIYSVSRDPFAPQSDFLQMLADGKLQAYKDEFYDLIQSDLDYDQEDLIRTFFDATTADNKTLIEVIQKLESLSQRKKISTRKMRSYVATSLELLLRNRNKELVRNDLLLNFSRQLLDQAMNGSTVLKLEAHFMMIVLHWPLEEKWSMRPIMSPVHLFVQNVRSWQKLIEDKPSKVKHTDKIICYIEESDIFPCLIRTEARQKTKLKIFKGNVSADGMEIEIMISAFRTRKDMPVIRIPFIRQVKRSSLWNRDMEVVIGFGLHGPKAEYKDDMLFFDSPIDSESALEETACASSTMTENNTKQSVSLGKTRIKGKSRSKKPPIARSSTLFTTMSSMPYLGPAKKKGPAGTPTTCTSTKPDTCRPSQVPQNLPLDHKDQEHGYDLHFPAL